MPDEVKNVPSPTPTIPQPVAGTSYGKEKGSFIEEVPKEPEIAPELTGYIERAPTDEVEVPYEKRLVGGLEPTKESVPVRAQPTGTLQIPYTKAELLGLAKIYKAVSDAKTWFIQFWRRQFKLQEHRLETKQEGEV